MDMRISYGGARSDVTTTDTSARVTPPASAPFADVVGRSAAAVARGAEAAVTSLPGVPIVAAAVRGAGPMTVLAGPGREIGTTAFTPTGAPFTPAPSPAPGAPAPAEGPTGTATSAPTGAASVEQALAQSQDFNLYYLQLQEQMAAENRSYSAMSNVLKSRHDTVKNAIGNIR